MIIPDKCPEEYTAGDLTVVRILTAVDTLLADTPFDSLTVADICREAGISRQTFYKHFKDKYQIAEWVWDRHSLRYLNNPECASSWRESVVNMITAFCSNERFVMGSLRSNDRNCLLEYGRMRRKEFLLAEAERRTGAAPSEEVAFAVDFFVNAESHAMRDWMLSSRRCPVEHIASLIERCVPIPLRDLFDEPGQAAEQEPAGRAGGAGREGCEEREGREGCTR